MNLQANHRTADAPPGSLHPIVVPRFVKAMSAVEAALMELEIVCPDEALKRETRSIREAYTQRRSALGQLMAKRHNDQAER
jgi:hypothetical protein